MKAFFRLILLGALLGAGAILPGLHGQASAPATAPAPAPAEPPVPPEATEPKAGEGELRRLDVTKPAAEMPAVVPAPDVPENRSAPKNKRVRNRTRSSSTHSDYGDQQLVIRGDVTVAQGQVIHDGAVAVLGDAYIDGEVKDDVVAVIGNVTINGTVTGEVVAVMGDVILGPKAHVDGEILSVGGQVIRNPGAYVGGRVVNPNVVVGEGANAWLRQVVRHGRPLAVGAHLTWLWLTTAAVLALYMLMAVMMPRQIVNCGEILVQRPMAVIVSAVLTMIAVPLLFVLLTATVVGIPISFIVLPIAVLLCVLFGKAAVYCLVGRAISRGRLSPALAVLIGAIPFVLLYMVPILGLLISVFVSLLGFGCAVVAILSSRKNKAAATVDGPIAVAPIVPMPAPAVTPAATVEGDVVATAVPNGADEPAAVPPAPVLPTPAPVAMPPLVTSAPRAGFWPRTGAMFIDLIIVGVAASALGGRGSSVLLALAVYAAIFWKLRGTTVGGIVCNLQVVRLDGRELDWPTACVRALGCFVSLFVGGLGFFWVAFDAEKQSWHDKIAGTVVVRTPKGKSLV